MILTYLSNAIKKLWEKISFHEHFKHHRFLHSFCFVIFLEGRKYRCIWLKINVQHNICLFCWKECIYENLFKFDFNFKLEMPDLYLSKLSRYKSFSSFHSAILGIVPFQNLRLSAGNMGFVHLFFKKQS